MNLYKIFKVTVDYSIIHQNKWSVDYLPNACMVTPLGCKNVLSPSNQVVVLISCTNHKQISKPYPLSIVADQTSL